jgi:PII-like signaling protein
MRIEAEQVLCRFQLSNFIRHGMTPLYEWIVETAHHEGLQGATVLKGFFGLRPQGSVLEEHTWSISQEVPVIVEVVDEPAVSRPSSHESNQFSRGRHHARTGARPALPRRREAGRGLADSAQHHYGTDQRRGRSADDESA